MNEKPLKILFSLLLPIAVGALYVRTYAFVNLRLDDWGYTAGCAFVKDGFSLANLGRAFSDFGHGAIWMPLTSLTYMLDISLFGGGWGVHHLVNVALHGANAILLFLLVARLLPCFGSTRDRTMIAAAAVAVLAWAIHPMRVEPVAWIAARKELLWTFFALLAFFPWMRFHEAGRKRDWLFAFCLFILACLSKPTALCFPLIAYAVQRFAFPEAKRRWRGYVPFLLVSVAVGGLTVFSQSNPTGLDRIDIYDTTLGWRLLNAAVSLGLYGWHVVAPRGVHFDYRAVFDGWPLDGGLGLAVLVGVLVCGGTLLFRLPKGTVGRRVLAFAFWGFLLPLVPALGIFGIVGDHAYADRYAYLPAAALAVPMALGVAWGLRRRRGLTGAFLALVLSGEVFWTIPLVGAFRDDVAVFTHVLKHDPDHWRALEYLGSEYCARLGKMDEGVAMLKRSLRLSPRPSSAATLAYVLAMRGAAGDFDEVRRLGARVAAQPKRDTGGMMLDALGIVAMREGHDKAAAEWFSQALVAPRRSHSNVHSLLNLGLCLANTGRDREALAVLAKLSGSRDAAIRRRAEEAIRAVSENEPYARFEWK